MKLSTRRDIAAAPEAVFAAISDFERLEAAARKRGAKVERVDDPAGSPAEAKWTLNFAYRGRPRQVDLRIVTYDPDQQIAAKGQLDGLAGLGNAEIVPLGPDRSRLHVSVDLKPSSMTARLLVQSLKLAKGSLERKLEARVESFARRIEAQ